MLHQFTWTQFFQMAAIALLLYYLLVAILFYRAEMKVSLEKLMAQVLPKVYLTSSPAVPSSFDETSEAVIGSISTRDAPVLSEATAIQVAPVPDEPPQATAAPTSQSPAIATAKEEQLFPMGTLADFLQELKSLLELVTETKMEKEEFLPLLQLVIARYNRATQGLHQDKVQLFLLEQCREKLPFELSQEEVQALWPQ